VRKIDFVKQITQLTALLKEECAKVGRKFDGFDITTAATPNLDMIKRLEDIGVTRACLSSIASDRDGITRSMEKVANDIIVRV
jgi:hypothetical protein